MQWITNTNVSHIHVTYLVAIAIAAIFVAGSAMISLSDYYSTDIYRERRANEEEAGLLRKLVNRNKKR